MKMALTDQAEKMLLHQFANSPKLKSLLRSLTQPFEEALEAIELLKLSLFIDSASGHVLDTIGTIVNQPRKDMADRDYRAWLKVRVLLNNNSGTPEELKRILFVLYGRFGDFKLYESKGRLTVDLEDHPTFTNENVLQSIINEAAPIGIKTKIQISYLAKE